MAERCRVGVAARALPALLFDLSGAFHAAARAPLPGASPLFARNHTGSDSRLGGDEHPGAPLAPPPGALGAGPGGVVLPGSVLPGRRLGPASRLRSRQRSRIEAPTEVGYARNLGGDCSLRRPLRFALLPGICSQRLDERFGALPGGPADHFWLRDCALPADGCGHHLPPRHFLHPGHGGNCRSVFRPHRLICGFLPRHASLPSTAAALGWWRLC